MSFYYWVKAGAKRVVTEACEWGSPLLFPVAALGFRKELLPSTSRCRPQEYLQTGVDKPDKTRCGEIWAEVVSSPTNSRDPHLLDHGCVLT